jgi:hypothetical protein
MKNSKKRLPFVLFLNEQDNQASQRGFMLKVSHPCDAQKVLL